MRILALLALIAIAGCLEERSAEDARQGVDAAGTPADAAADAPDADAPPEADAAVTVDSEAPDAAPVGLALGAACVASAECASGACALPWDGYGVCVPATCEGDADCAVDGAPRAHCCVGGVCAASNTDTCGDQSGEQGDNCRNGASDCAEGLACVDGRLPTSYCAAPCEDTAACQALDAAAACYRVPAGDMRCVQDPNLAVACGNTRDCRAGSICVPFPSFRGDGVIKTCRPVWGPKKVGQGCVQDQDCQSAYCTEGRCTAGCLEDADCACPPNDATCATQICVDTWFRIAPSQYQALLLCARRTRCEQSADCDEGDECSAYVESRRRAAICEPPGAAARAAGEPCENDEQCRSLACHDGACRALCGDDAHCAVEGETCQAAALEVPEGDPVDVSVCR